MSENAQARGTADDRPAPAAEFRSVLSGGVGGAASGEPAGSPVHDPPAPPAGTAEGAQEATAVPRITGALSEPSATRGREEALDRPGRPVLAGAAIAGLLMVAAPFAMTAGVPGVTLESTPLASGAGGAGGQAPGTAEADGSGGGGSGGAAAQADAGTAPQQGSAPQETGYIPEVVGDGSTAPTMPDPGTGVTGGTGGEDPVEAAPAVREGSEEASAPAGESTAEESGAEAAVSGEGIGEGTPADGAEDGAAAGDGGGEADVPSGGDGTAAEASADGNGANAPAADAEAAGSGGGGEEGTGANREGGDTAAQEQDTAPADTAGDGSGGAADTGAEGVPGTSSEGQAAEPRMAEGQHGADPQPPSEGGGSVLEDAVATTGASEAEPFLAVAGPGCQASPGASYTNAGRWDSAEGTSSWATRPGGYAQEGCDGGYEALPVSGDPERGDGQYAAWTFTPGEAGVVCELYVHVPDDESPLWVSPGEARYQLFSGPAAEGSAVAVFGFDQARIRGGWVQVTGFTSPTEEFTVQLTNAGADALADREHTSAHVAASAVRASCS
ncbi:MULTISPECIES: serine/threonine-protein kinase [Nocardiopsis]|uniref:Uncharacterized protein n=1 Tax=Nocardiopsis sinuspersici TaxID=501010 RepID=A0A1V3BXG3_9ACTN|nr:MULTISPECIES: hypothetical protein [Nocardiopsis]OOC53254.1 hypothetical protein NOSIN_05000 [Nocardiopsis sinuspersici]